jgi:hypothetical protein
MQNIYDIKYILVYHICSIYMTRYMYVCVPIRINTLLGCCHLP